MAHGTIIICSGCKRQKVGKRWYKSLAHPKNIRVSHGMCDECVRELYPEDAEWIIKRAAAQDEAKRAHEIGG